MLIMRFYYKWMLCIHMQFEMHKFILNLPPIYVIYVSKLITISVYELMYW